MQNNDFFNDDSVKVGSLTPANHTAVAPLPAVSPVSSAMLMAAADPNTKRRFTKAMLDDICTSALAYSALENCFTLTAIEAHLCTVAPGGAHRYQQIVDAYAATVKRRLERW